MRPCLFLAKHADRASSTYVCLRDRNCDSLEGVVELQPEDSHDEGFMVVQRTVVGACSTTT